MGFDIEVADGVVRILMPEHFPSAAEARRAVADLLRSWEIAAAIDEAEPWLRLEFMDVEVIDRDPPGPDEPQVVQVDAAEIVMTAEQVVVHKERLAFPAPPTDFVASADVETMWLRFKRYREGRESLATMGYACLTWLEHVAGSRRDAVKLFNIDKEVLRELGRLTSTVGDQVSARKFSAESDLRPFHGQETMWIEAAILRIIRRVGEVAAAHGRTGSPPAISMKDLPPLP